MLDSQWRAGVLILLAAATLLPACQSKESGGAPARALETSSKAASGASLRVVVVRPRASEGAQNLVLPGTVEPWEKAALYARVTGYLDSVAVDIGDQVEKGADIAAVVVPEVRAELRSAQARVAQEQAELELARVTRRRLAHLRQDNPEAIPQQDVDVAAAKEHIEVAQVGVAEADLDRLRALAAYAQMQAPFTGRVTRRLLDPGALVREGTTSDAQPIVELARTDRLRVAFEVPEPVSRAVRTGTAVKLYIDAFPGREIDATVSRVSGALHESTRSMRAEIDLDNPEGQYGPGMYVSVHLSAQAVPDALGVPSRGVRGQGSERYCLVARDGLLRRAPVVVAADDGRLALIARGLSAEDRVVIAGSPLAQDGSRVEAVEEQAQ